MATIIQTPDSLSLLKNLKSYVISSSTEVAFALSIGGSTIIEETYTPDANGRVEIQVRDVVAGYLSTALPSTNQYQQANAVKTFAASVNSTGIGSFTVINGGVRKLSVTTENFLKANWLTWQPQNKKVTWDSPEYLTYYFVVAGTVKAKFYYKAGGTKVVTVATGTAGQMQTFNMAMSRLFTVGDVTPADMYGMVDVWVEDGSGVVLSYVQRYTWEDTQGDEHVYLAVNSLGGIDTFTFHAERKAVPAIDHESGQLEDVLVDITQNAVRKWEQSTGYLGNKESNWLYELIASKSAWAIIENSAEAMVIDSDSAEYSDLSTLAIGSFSFTLSEDGGLLNIARTPGQLPVIEVPTPTGQLFFLEARLIDYPDADIAETLLLLAQSPFSQDWFRLDLGSSLDWIYSSVVNSPIGQMAHTHENLLVLGRLSESSNRLAYRGVQLATIDDIPTVPPSPVEWFVPAYDEHGDAVGAKALYDLFIVQDAADEEEGTPETQKNISEILRHLFLEEHNDELCLRSDITFFSDRAVSAGGLSTTEGESGGGINADAMWQLLADATSEQINLSHLTTALTSYATQTWVQAQGYLTQEDLPDSFDPMALTTGLAEAYSRLDALEYWLQYPYLEEATLSALHISRTLDLGGVVLDYDYTNDAWHLHGNMYVDGYLSAGGMSDTQGGAAGGIDEEGLWELLAAATNEQINISHIANAIAPYATREWVNAQGFLRDTGSDLMPTNVGLAAALSRLDSLEAWVVSPYIEEMTANALHLERTIDIGGTAISYDYAHDAIHVHGNIYADGFVSAGGMSSTGSGTGGGIDPTAMWALLADGTPEKINASHLPLDVSMSEGNYVQGISYRGGIFSVVRAQLPTYVSSVGMSVPAGFNIGGSPITGSGTLALSFANGYSLPTNTKQGQWDTAYEWGNHAQAGYAMATDLISLRTSVDKAQMALSTGISTNAGRIASLEAWLQRPALEDLTASTITVERSISLGGMALVYDYSANAWHLKGNIYADGFVSAGGYSGSQSEGGINAAAMWQLLAAATNEQINISHLSDALNGYATQAWVQAQGYSLTAEAIAIALNYVPVSPDDLHPLAVSLASATSRLDTLETWIVSPYIEELTANALHLERSIDIGGMVITYDYANSALHVQGNLYADGFISAGGLSPVQSTGGISESAMWALLAAATSEPINASHLPLSVSLSEGNYVQGISYSAGVFSVVRATMPTALKNPAALTFGSKSYDGSAGVSLVASDLGAITYVRSFDQTLTRGTTKTIATVGSTDINVTMPNFAFASDIPTYLPNPYALTFGSKTYDGSAAKTITASDLGALTSHQRIYSLRIYNSSNSSVLYYIPTYGDETLTLTKAMVGLGNVENTALSTWSGSSYITTLGTITTGTWHGSAITNSYLANSSITLAGRSVSLGGSITQSTMLSDLGLSSAASNISTLLSYFNSSGVANSAARLSGTASKTVWGRTFWSGGTPDSVSGAMSSVTNINALIYFYNSDTRVGIGNSRPDYALDVAGVIRASSDIIAGGYVYIGGTNAYIRYVSSNAGLNVNVGIYSNSYVSAGGYSSSSDRRLKTDITGINAQRAWSIISRLRPVEFSWIADGTRSAGFIAQEVEPILPESVVEVGGIKRLHYDIVFSYGIAALQELRRQTKTNEQKIANVEKRVIDIERKLQMH